MANRSNEAAGAAALNGLVGGFLMGDDLRKRRTLFSQEQEDRTRRHALEDESLANVREDRGFAATDRTSDNAIRDYNFTRETGLAFEDAGPGGLDEFGLRARTGASLLDVDQEGVPDSMVRVGLSERDEMYRVLGRQLAMDPALVEAAHETDTLDDLMGNSGATYGATGEGNPTMSGGTIAEQEAFLDANPRSTRGPNSTASYGVGANGEMTMSGGSLGEATRFSAGQQQEDEPVSLEEAAIFDTLNLTPEMQAFVNTMPREERQAFILDAGERPSATESERRAAAVFPRAELGLEKIDELLEFFGGAPGLSALAGDRGRAAQSAEIQTFNAAAEATASAILRFESGAAIGPTETSGLIRAMIPQPIDKPATIEFKLEVLRAQVGALGQAASSVTGDTGGGSSLEAMENAVIDAMTRMGASPEEIAEEIGRRTPSTRR